MQQDDSAAVARLQDAFAAQRAAYARRPVPTADQRRDHLRALIATMVAYRSRIHDALQVDYGSHPKVTSDLVEVAAPISRAEMAIASLDAWMAPEPRPADGFDGATAVMARQPKGVIGLMSPWNFPFELTCGPLVDMLAAGNRVIMKPSEVSPACSALLAEMMAATFAPDHVTTAIGGVELARAFATLPWDHLMFTGGTEVGREVMLAAAANLTPLTLELGGKCPVVILDGGLTKDAIASIVGLKLIKNGQVCVSVDHVLVPRDRMEQAARMITEYMAAHFADHSRSPDYTGLISERHATRLRGLVDEARAGGARVLTFEADRGAETPNRVMPLHVVVDPDPALRVCREEIFGPVLPLIAHDGVADVVARINAGGRPLAIYVYGDNDADIDMLVAGTVSGGVTINGAAHHTACPTLGFGGVGPSGIGRHHGIEGFREFSNYRAIMTRKPGLEGVMSVCPPYSAGAVADCDAFFSQYAAG